MTVALGAHKCHFSNRKTNISKSDPQECHPCQGKTRRAESACIVVVAFSKVGIKILPLFFYFKRSFFPNALFYILW